MNILLVSPYYVPAQSYGGIVKVVHELAQEMNKLGHAVTVATTDVHDAVSRATTGKSFEEGVSVVRFKNLSNGIAYRYNVYLPVGWVRWCTNNLRKFDIVHCNDAYTWMNIVVARKCHKQNIPYVIQPHGALNSERVRFHLYFVKRIFLYVFRRMFLGASSLVVSTTREKEEEVRALFPTLLPKTVVIPNGISEMQLSNPVIDQEFRQQFGVGEGMKLFLYFGRIHPVKGIDITLQALAKVRGVRYKFLIVGRDENGELQRLKVFASQLGIAQNFLFRKPTFGTEMQRILHSADVFLFNSRSEGLPMAVLDACAAGLPSILSPYCNVPEVSIYKAGIVLSSNTPEETASAIQQLCSTTTMDSAHMRQQCHALIRDRFSLKVVTSQYIRLFSSLLKAKYYERTVA